MIAAISFLAFAMLCLGIIGHDLWAEECKRCHRGQDAILEDPCRCENPK